MSGSSQTLVWNGTNWVPVIAGAGGTITSNEVTSALRIINNEGGAALFIIDNTTSEAVNISNTGGGASMVVGNTATGEDVLRLTAATASDNAINVLQGNVLLPSGTLATPPLQFGAADGTGISRSANALVVGVQNTMVLGMFAGSSQFYSPLSMLNNKITQLADATAAGDALNMRTGDARYAPYALATEVAALRAEVQALRGRANGP